MPSDLAVTIVYPVIRLVINPKRFLDDADEPIAKKGMGVVYEKTPKKPAFDQAPSRPSEWLCFPITTGRITQNRPKPFNPLSKNSARIGEPGDKKKPAAPSWGGGLRWRIRR